MASHTGDHHLPEVLIQFVYSTGFKIFTEIFKMPANVYLLHIYS